MAVEDLNFFLALGTLSLQIITVALLVAFSMRAHMPAFGDVIAPFARHALRLAFLLSLSGLIVTLYYSDVLGIEPCPLCWWQRIFLYPQIVLAGMALWKEKYCDAAIDFSIILSVLGALVALYHHALQMFPSGHLPCPATGPSCAQITFLEFGYITYPLMAFSLFAFVIVLLLTSRSERGV